MPEGRRRRCGRRCHGVFRLLLERVGRALGGVLGCISRFGGSVLGRFGDLVDRGSGGRRLLLGGFLGGVDLRTGGGLGFLGFGFPRWLSLRRLYP